ncbi:MAG: hypothetical protein KGJ13_09715, partial [Patescibacteria group bacterium]|nr:hypothetical protein [Patescibacteria group bacterium]
VLEGEAASYRRALAAGITLGVAALVRTPAAFLVVPMAGYFLLRKRYMPLFFFCLSAFLVFTPWIARNYGVYRTFVPTNLAYGIDLAAGNHPGASGELEPYPRNDQVVAEYGKIEATHILTREALVFMVSRPLEFAQITLRRISIYFSFARPTGFWFFLSGLSEALTLVSSSVYAAILFFLGFVGLAFSWKGMKNFESMSYWFSGMLVMMPLSVIFIIVETRYRFLSYPFFAIFAGLGFWAMFHKKISPKKYAAIAGLILLNSGFDIISNVGRIIQRIQAL